MEKIKKNKINIMKEVFNDWVFHFNPYAQVWNATKRETYNDLFNKPSSKNVITSSKIDTLIHLIQITDGNISKMNKLAK